MADYVTEKQFVYRGILCIIRFITFSGCRCGYICIPENNKFYRNSSLCQDVLYCHGGITYTTEGSTNIHLPDEDDNFYIGFDCAHFPIDFPDIETAKKYGTEKLVFKPDNLLDNEGHVWTIDEVEEELRNLVNQILA